MCAFFLLTFFQLSELKIVDRRFHFEYIFDKEPIDYSSLDNVAIYISNYEESQLLDNLNGRDFILSHIIKCLFIPAGE